MWGVVVGRKSPFMLVMDQMEDNLMLVLRVYIDEVHGGLVNIVKNFSDFILLWTKTRYLLSTENMI